MLWLHNFHFLSVAWFVRGVLKCKMLKSKWFCIGSLWIYTFLIPTHLYNEPNKRLMRKLKRLSKVHTETIRILLVGESVRKKSTFLYMIISPSIF